jgi:hypothetical protein
MSAVVLRVADILAVDLSSSTAEIVPTPEDIDVVEVASFEEVAAFERTSAPGRGIGCRLPLDLSNGDAGFVSNSLQRTPGWDRRFHSGRPVARLLGAAVILAMLPQGVLDQIGVGQQPPQSDVLLVQHVEFLGGVGVHPAVGAAPDGMGAT